MLIYIHWKKKLKINSDTEQKMSWNFVVQRGHWRFPKGGITFVFLKQVLHCENWNGHQNGGFWDIKMMDSGIDFGYKTCNVIKTLNLAQIIVS